MEQKPAINETDPQMTPITISMVDGLYYITRDGLVDLQFTSYNDLTDFLAETLPEISGEQQRGKVVVEVLGGVAEVTSAPTGVEVEIIDHDNEVEE